MIAVAVLAGGGVVLPLLLHRRVLLALLATVPAAGAAVDAPGAGPLLVGLAGVVLLRELLEVDDDRIDALAAVVGAATVTAASAPAVVGDRSGLGPAAWVAVGAGASLLALGAAGPVLRDHRRATLAVATALTGVAAGATAIGVAIALGAVFERGASVVDG